jgi:hypothetical protein
MSNHSDPEVVRCPLCKGHGRERSEVLVLRSRSRDFEQELQRLADEVFSGEAGGMEDLFELEHTYSNESD